MTKQVNFTYVSQKKLTFISSNLTIQQLKALNVIFSKKIDFYLKRLQKNNVNTSYKCKTII